MCAEIDFLLSLTSTGISDAIRIIFVVKGAIGAYPEEISLPSLSS